MGIKLVVAAAILLVSIPSLAQVEPQATAGRSSLNWSVGGGMDYSRAIGELEHQQVGAIRMGHLKVLALPRHQCGRPLHDHRRKPAGFEVQALRR